MRVYPLHPWTKVNLWLGALLLALLALDRLPIDGRNQPLLSLPLEQVSEIRIESGARLRLAARRNGDDWRLTHPHDSAAQTARINQLLAVTRAPVRYSFAAPADLARYGLSPPAAVLQLSGATDLRNLVAFGDRDLEQEHRYVLVDGDIRLIDDHYFSLLLLPPSHFAVD